jgi:aldehyde dehydrogenase (NAD+)
MNAPHPPRAIATPSKHFIGNRWVAAATGDTLPMIDPSDGLPFAAIAAGTAADIDRAVAAAQRARDGAWGRLAPAEKGRLLAKLGRAILDCADELALTEARDCGKPMKQARADVIACARYFEFYGGACDKLHGETIPYPAGYTVLTWREPHGVTGHIIPWNYPMQIFGRSVGGALAAGNACVVKPAEDACLSLLRIAELAAGVGMPDGAINIVTGLGREAGAALAAHPGIEHLSFTGSPATGAGVASEAAKRHCPVTLELGGKGPQVVFADADLDVALPVIVNAIVQNAGQTCSAGSRLLVERSRYEEVLEKLGARFAALTVGPALADLDCGPLIRAGQRDRVRAFLSGAERDGIATVAKGIVVPDAPAGGYYVEPRLLATYRPVPASRARRCSGPCSRRCPSQTNPTRSASPTRPISGLSPACGRETAGGSCGWRARSAAARCSSTTMAREAVSNCRSAASSTRAMDAKRDSRRSMDTPFSRRWCCNMGERDPANAHPGAHGARISGLSHTPGHGAAPSRGDAAHG